MNKKIRTRFAPSPTGFMHIGNLRTALYAYLYAKSQGGDFLLRIEDTDQARYVDGAVDFIYRTLAAAGIHADEGPGIGGDFGPYVQSERKAIYKEYAEKLIELGAAYRCFCGPEERHADGTFGKYAGTCRDLTAAKIQAKLDANTPYVIRQKMPTTGETTYYDEIHGTITIANEELEDQILLKSDGMPTYNFANVIDDHLMEITHVLRGTEYITSTPKHVLLYKAFGWELPHFVHLSPVMGKNEDGSVSKLSKRHGATSFEDLTAKGYLPEAITNYVALLGWSPKGTNQEIFTAEELLKVFTPAGLSKSPAVFDYDKLGWVSGEYFKQMTDDAFAAAARPFAGELPENIAANWGKIATLLKTRVLYLAEIPEQIAFLLKLPAFNAELYVNKKNKVTVEVAKELLPALKDVLEGMEEENWNNDALFARLSEHIERAGVKKGTAMWVLRIAIAGQSVTPGGATELLSILGKEESLARLEKSLANLQNL